MKPDADLSDMDAEELQAYAGRIERADWQRSEALSGVMHELDTRGNGPPGVIRAPNPSAAELGGYDTGDLYQLLGEIEQTRYTLADAVHRIMVELDAREDA